MLLPPGELTMTYGRGPEYHLDVRKITVPEKGDMDVKVKLRRWINPMDYGLYSGDHHIHAAGCAHYTNPTEGVFAQDMFLHVKGEGLNVGCNLTWGPCYDFQRQFFEPQPHKLSEPFTVLKYDVEVSGFGSQALGHVCLLNLQGSDLSRLGGHQDQGLADLDDAADALGQDCRGPTPATPTRPTACSSIRWASRPAPWPSEPSPRWTRTRTASFPARKPTRACCPTTFDAIDANKDGFLTEQELFDNIHGIDNVRKGPGRSCPITPCRR